MQTVKSFRLIILARLDLDLEFSFWFLWGLNKTIKAQEHFFRIAFAHFRLYS